MTLYELTGQFKELLVMAEDQQLDQQAIADTLEGLEYEIEEKAEQYAKVIRCLEGDVASVESEINRLEGKRDTIEGNIETLKRTLEYAMISTGKKKFKTALFSINVQKNAPALDILDEQKVPAEFYKLLPPKLDRKAALQFVKDHGEQEWGILKQSESLRIR
ncbi:MAG: siphovirus Gp157 family protein [Lachnospiraceae bacterium]|nr:siphovirus Gp157 family protein [Lachnospiraceae bacterium]